MNFFLIWCSLSPWEFHLSRLADDLKNLFNCAWHSRLVDMKVRLLNWRRHGGFYPAPLKNLATC
jgi:hypothetical protein